MNLPDLEISNPSVPSINQEVVTDVKKDPKKKKKKLWDKLWRKNKLKKPTTVAVLYLRSNNKAEPFELESKNGFYSVAGRTYSEDQDCIYRLPNGTPLAIIPDWSLIPYGTRAWHDKPMLQKFGELEDHALKGIRRAELVRMGGEDGGTKMNPKAVIGGVILAIIVIAVIYQVIG